MEFVKNNWYAAAWSDEIKHQLLARTILAEEIVLYRTSQGAVVAFADLCPHRLLPLSKGELRGDHLQCGYHGMTFDRQGNCVSIPAQKKIPKSAKLRQYAVAENMGLVFLWMGDPEKADRSQLYDLPQYHDPQWDAVHGEGLTIHSHYLNVADNLCDPAHVAFVHKSTLGNPESAQVPVRQKKINDQLMLAYRWIIDSPPIPLFQKFGHFKKNVDRWHYYYYHAPSTAVIDFGSAETGTGAPEGNRDDCIQIFACHFITPVTATQSVDYWLHVKNFHPVEAAVNEKLNQQFRIAFNEDKAILEAIQERELKYPDFKRTTLAIDSAPHQMRKMVQNLVRLESVGGIQKKESRLL